jgi:ribosomal-protein-alanine N-acetyltransferase
MTLADIPQVVQIDRRSFRSAWSEKTYAYEIRESPYTFMVVIEERWPIPPARGWRRLWQFLTQVVPTTTENRILGYGGLWCIQGEAHISTIASHPDYRRRGYGEILLASMIQKSLFLEANQVVLEVRVSNVNAQRLYQKWGFVTAGIKEHYYHDDGEDAYDMRLPLDDSVRLTFPAQYSALIAQSGLDDEYTAFARTRG